MRSLARQDTGRLHGRDGRPDATRFCTHCGAVQNDAPQRVCGRCGFGVILTSAREALGEAFLVVTLDMRVAAASAAVEKLLGDPDELLGLPLPAVLSGDDLGRLIGRAALGSRRIVTVTVSAKATGRRLSARIAWCGQPPAALVVLE
jgi:PAS domain-containing protein